MELDASSATTFLNSASKLNADVQSTAFIKAKNTTYFLISNLGTAGT